MHIEDERITHLLTDSQQAGRGDKVTAQTGDTPTAVPAAARREGEQLFPHIGLPLLEALINLFPCRTYTPGLTLDMLAYYGGQHSVVDFLVNEYNAQLKAAHAAATRSKTE